MNLHKSDLRHIGHTAFHRDDCLTISSDGPAFEQIMLREILALTGHQITHTEDVENFVGNEYVGTDVVYYTDMPWNEYSTLSDEAR